MKMSTSQRIGQSACNLVKEYEERQGRTVKKAPQDQDTISQPQKAKTLEKSKSKQIQGHN